MPKKHISIRAKKCQRIHPFAGKGWCWNPIWLNGIPTTLPYCIVWSLQRGARGLHYVTKMVVVGNLWVGISEIHQNAVVLKHCLVKCNSKSFPYVLFDPFKGGLEVHIMWPCLGKCNTKSFPSIVWPLHLCRAFHWEKSPDAQHCATKINIKLQERKRKKKGSI